MLSGQESRQLEGWDGKLLAEPHACRQLVISEEATLNLGYGLQRDALENREYAARFTVKIKETSTKLPVTLMDEVV